jgi:hypothetical protein
MRTRIAVIALVALLPVGCSRTSRVARSLEALAESPSQFVLYSLSPERTSKDETVTSTQFYGYNILGSTPITDPAEQRALLRALAHGARENSNSAAMCFNPRHALHIEREGRSVDLAICFECLQVEAHGFSVTEWFTISQSPEATFDESLTRHVIPKAMRTSELPP